MAKYPTRKRLFDLVGEGQVNANGKNRQLELKRCQPGESVELFREPNNPYDPFAVGVISPRGVQIGYMRSEHARDIAPALDEGRQCEAIITALTGGLPDYPNFGCEIGITWDGQKPLVANPIRPEQSLYDCANASGKLSFWKRLFG